MRSFASRLLAWYDQHRRDLPWRRTSDPWAIWVSEVMLQQTRVEAVRSAHARFMAAYPTPAALAEADDDQLHAAWRGLGYYRRARLLRDGARAVVAEHGGVVPADAERLGQLPGIGRYTRGALASIAFGAREPAIDGNVERVLARHRALRGNVKTGAVQRQLADIVREHQPAARPGDFNQALMELGAMVCTPASPGCDRCPVAADCRGRQLSLQQLLPLRPPPRPSIEVQARMVLAPVRGGVLAFRIPPGEVNAGQLELPGAGALVSIDDRSALAPALRQRFGAVMSIGPELAAVRHSITQHRITCRLHAASARSRGELIAAAPFDAALPWSTLSRKLLQRSGLAATD